MDGDVCSDLGKDDHLSNLVTACSEIEMPRPAKAPKRIVRAQKLDYMQKQLKFVYDCGVVSKIKPSPENILDGDFADVMGLVFAIMLKFMRFDDGDDGETAGNARDALLRWCQYHTAGFVNVNVTNLTKDWANGLALCALVAKFAPPGAVDFASLDPANALANIETAMEAANKYFKVEKFITAADVRTLCKAKDGDKSMLVVVSEYYYGINAFFKRKLAGNRITKVVVFTRENDERRRQYAAHSAQLSDRLAESEALLGDVATVDDTMAGATQRLASFKEYKTNQKSQIMTLYLELMGNFQTLALRLANNGRPPFAPAAELTPDALKARIAGLEAKEVVEPKLYAELNRQNKLVALHARHTAEAEKLSAWIAREGGALREPIACANSGDARKQLKQFGSFQRALEGKKTTTFTALAGISAELDTERYEAAADAHGREATIQTGFGELDAQAALNEPALKDNLERELFKEALTLKVDVHADINDNLVAWASKKTMYFKTKEEVASVLEARLQLSTLDSADREVTDVKSGNYARLQELGGEIRAAEYKTALSEWRYPTPDEVTGLEQAMEGSLAELAAQSAAKRAVLDDDLAREKVKERVELLAKTHLEKQESVLGWGEAKGEYLDNKEPVDSSAAATSCLAVLEAFEKERASFEAAEIALLRELGATIRNTKYETEHSRWEYEDIAVVDTLEAAVDTMLDALATAAVAKKAVLEDDLARELYAEESRLLAGQHVDTGIACAKWANDKAAYLQTDVVVHSIREAQVALSVLDAYMLEKERFTATGVASLKKLGATVLARAYLTELSSWEYENPDDVTEREAEVDDHWNTLDQLAAARKQTLGELLSRESRKEELRVEFADLASDYVAYANDVVAVIGNVDAQKTLFGTTIAEVEAYDATLAGLDAAIDGASDAKTLLVDNAVREMAQLVQATKEFDDAQRQAAEGPEEPEEPEPEPAPEEKAAPASPKGKRRSRFGTLSKSLKRAFGKSKKKKSQLQMLKDARRASMEAGDVEWPEESNPYTMLSVSVIRHKRGAVEAAQKARRENYAAELERWRGDDAACKRFAEEIDPMQAAVSAMLQSLMATGATEEEQLEAVTSVVAELQTQCFKLPNAQKLAAEVEKRRVVINPYSTNSVGLIESELETTEAVAQKKRRVLQEQVEYLKLRGIAAETWEEMGALFKEFDANNSGTISAKELRSCLFSLGEERSKSEVTTYLERFAAGAKELSFEQFRALMVELIGDMGTVDGLNESFRLLALGRDYVTLDPGLSACVSDGLLTAEDVDFVANEAPTTEEGIDYAAFVGAVCSR